MRLKTLTLSGFKSFAKKTTLEFSAPIVAVVGPNGSGKSNVAEAFRFVLGEQSVKSMRGKRGEDLIFVGTGSSPKMGVAEVSLTFDNKDKTFNLDFEEVTLGRAVYRDGVNEYKLNGSTVRLRDNLELLASANIGSSGHHIISQGEADRILSASITERREMIEDALALKVYHFKKDESERKLLKTRENLDKASAIRKEILPHLRFLEKQTEKVKKSEELQADLLRLYQDYLSKEEAYLSAEKERLESVFKAPRAEVAEIEKKLSAIKDRLSKQGEQRLEEKLLRLEEELTKSESIREELLRKEGLAEGALRSEERLLERLRKSKAETLVPLPELEKLLLEVEGGVREAESLSDVPALRALISRLGKMFRGFMDKQKSGGQGDADESSLKLLKDSLEKANLALKKAEKTSLSLKEEVEAVRKQMTSEATEGREGEREMFTLLNRKSELAVSLSELEAASRLRGLSEEAFKEELKEAQAILGLSVMHYGHIKANKEELLREPRKLQEERKKTLEKIKIRLEEMGGVGGADIMKEYGEVREREAFFAKEIEDLEKSAEDLENIIAELTEKLDAEFRLGVEKINTEFKKFFTTMFGGGHASLFIISREKRARRKEGEDLEAEAEEAEEEGVAIDVSLPGKRTKGLQMLSGGERALTSIALIFAISQVNPPPFIILDETDAALDESNSRKYGDMIESLSKSSQLILITHNRETMSRAGILYGVTMGADGVSKLLSVKFDEAVAVAK